jgi:hypothetical protein
LRGRPDKWLLLLLLLNAIYRTSQSIRPSHLCPETSLALLQHRLGLPYEAVGLVAHSDANLVNSVDEFGSEALLALRDKGLRLLKYPFCQNVEY